MTAITKGTGLTQKSDVNQHLWLEHRGWIRNFHFDLQRVLLNVGFRTDEQHFARQRFFESRIINTDSLVEADAGKVFEPNIDANLQHVGPIKRHDGAAVMS